MNTSVKTYEKVVINLMLQKKLYLSATLKIEVKYKVILNVT